jgi:cytochrome c553
MFILYLLAGELGTCHAAWVAVTSSRLALAFVLWHGLAHAQQVPDTLEQRLVACAACHGKKGEGLKANEYYPRIAGKPARYLFNQLVNFRERRRQSPAMNYMVGFLSDDYLRDIARYYAMQPPRYPAPQEKPSGEVQARGEALMQRGDPVRKIPACAACHGERLTGMEPAIPGLVGLEVHYIGAQMGAWRNRLRRAQAPDCMANIASLLIPGDVEAIAAYLASLPPPAHAEPLPAGSLKLPMECGGA